MATRKRKRKSNSRKPMSQSVSRRVSKGRSKRRSASRSKMGLSEMMNPASATHTGKGMLRSAVVGYGVRSVEPMLETLPKYAQHIILLGGSFVAGTVLKMDGVSNSLATIWGYKLAGDMQGMNDDGDWADEDSLEEEEEYMDENGTPMYLADDGNVYYLEELYSDDELSEMEESELGEGTYLANGLPYPSYVEQDRQ